MESGIKKCIINDISKLQEYEGSEESEKSEKLLELKDGFDILFNDIEQKIKDITEEKEKEILIRKLPSDVLSVILKKLTRQDANNVSVLNKTFREEIENIPAIFKPTNESPIILNKFLQLNESQQNENFYIKIFDTDLKDDHDYFENKKYLNNNGNIISKIQFNHTSNVLPKLHKLPQTLTHLTFSTFNNYYNNNDNNTVDFSILPQTLTHLTLDGNFNKPVNLSENVNLTHLEFGENFNQPVDLSKNVNLTHLTFGYKFNQQVDLSKNVNLTHLTFGEYFNNNLIQQVNFKNLTNLTELTFGNSFNQPVDLSKNVNLTHLVFGQMFNKDLVGKLPNSLTHLVFSEYFNQKVNFENLTNLTHLTFSLMSHDMENPVHNPVDFLSNNVKLKYLSLSYKFNQPVDLRKNVNLTHLVFGQNFNKDLGQLPESLTHLVFGQKFNKEVNLSENVNLTHLVFGYDFNEQVKLPPNLTHLTFGTNFRQKVDLKNLTNLTDHNNKTIDLSNNVNLTNLYVGNKNTFFKDNLDLPKTFNDKIKLPGDKNILITFKDIKYIYNNGNLNRLTR